MTLVLGVVLVVLYLSVPPLAGWGLSRVARSRRLPWLLLLAFVAASVTAYLVLALVVWPGCEPRDVCDDQHRNDGAVIAAVWFAGAFALLGAFWGRPRREPRPDDDLAPWNPAGDDSPNGA